MLEDCRFCNEFQIGKTEFMGDVLERILFQSDNFYVFPSLGQIVEGYLLISPKEHYISIAQLPDKLYNELEEVQEKTIKILVREYQEPIFFEHGPISEREKGGCCIAHAHLHAVPAKADLLKRLEKHFSYFKISLYNELPKDMQYLFFQNNQRERFVIPIREIIPSQYLRQLLASELNIKKWDWRLYPEFGRVKNVIKKLRGKF